MGHALAVGEVQAAQRASSSAARLSTRGHAFAASLSSSAPRLSAAYAASLAATSRRRHRIAAALKTIPGVKQRTAEVLISEIGVDMSAFPTPKHLASWAGVCPGNDQSAGKRRSGKTRTGSKWLRATLTESALAAARTKDSYLAAQYQRLRGRGGHSKAVTAAGYSILTAAWHMLQTGELYRDLGNDYFTRQNPDRLTRRLIRQLQALGHHVTLERTPTAPRGRRLTGISLQPPNRKVVHAAESEGRLMWALIGPLFGIALIIAAQETRWIDESEVRTLVDRATGPEQ